MKYFIGLKLFGTIVAEETSHIQLGREIKVFLIKAHKCKQIYNYKIYILFNNVTFYTFKGQTGLDYN
jgi:hypothetical protein